MKILHKYKCSHLNRKLKQVLLQGLMQLFKPMLLPKGGDPPISVHPHKPWPPLTSAGKNSECHDVVHQDRN